MISWLFQTVSSLKLLFGRNSILEPSWVDYIWQSKVLIYLISAPGEGCTVSSWVGKENRLDRTTGELPSYHTMLQSLVYERLSVMIGTIPLSSWALSWVWAQGSGRGQNICYFRSFPFEMIGVQLCKCWIRKYVVMARLEFIHVWFHPPLLTERWISREIAPRGGPEPDELRVHLGEGTPAGWGGGDERVGHFGFIGFPLITWGWCIKIYLSDGN